MKININYMIMALFGIAIGLYSCSKGDDSLGNPSTGVSTPLVLTTQEWTIDSVIILNAADSSVNMVYTTQNTPSLSNSLLRFNLVNSEGYTEYSFEDQTDTTLAGPGGNTAIFQYINRGIWGVDNVADPLPGVITGYDTTGSSGTKLFTWNVSDTVSKVVGIYSATIIRGVYTDNSGTLKILSIKPVSQ